MDPLHLSLHTGDELGRVPPADEQLVLPRTEEAALPVHAHHAGAVLRVDDVDARRRHRDVVDVGLRARDPTVAQHLDTAVDELREASSDGPFTGGALPPGADVLRLVRQREDAASQHRVGVADALSRRAFRRSYSASAEPPAVPVTRGRTTAG
jgi:hypothetical protein